MRSTVLSIAFTLMPALLVAQATGTAKTDTHAGATVQTRNARAAGSATVTTQTSGEVSMRPAADSDYAAPQSFSAEGKAKMSAMFRAAHDENIPDQSMKNRVAEGQAKGASEAQIIESTAMLKARLESSQQAMIRAGHHHPSDTAVDRGAQAEEQGATSAQIETVARHASSDHSLTVALDVLTKLVARGVPTERAVAAVQGNLDAHASDSAMASLTSTVNATGSAASNVGQGAAAGASAAGNAAAGVTGAAKGAGVTGTATGAVTGAVGAVVKKP